MHKFWLLVLPRSCKDSVWPLPISNNFGKKRPTKALNSTETLQMCNAFSETFITLQLCNDCTKYVINKTNVIRKAPKSLDSMHKMLSSNIAKSCSIKY
jgi:hypothetical protein